MTTLKQKIVNYLWNMLNRKETVIYPDEKFNDLAVHRIIALLKTEHDQSEFEFVMRHVKGEEFWLTAKVIINDTLSFVVYNDKISLGVGDTLTFSMPYPYDISVV